MNPIECSVSLHPYFKVHAGKLEEARALLPEFLEKTETEDKVLYYEFTIHEDEIFCREAYLGADGVLAHLTNVGATLQKMLAIADLTRLEIHGPEAELQKLKGPLADLNPAWFTYACGLKR